MRILMCKTHTNKDVEDFSDQDCIKFQIQEPPEQSDWSCYLFGSSERGLIYTPRKGDVPNFFIRQMTRLLLGCKWVKTEKSRK